MKKHLQKPWVSGLLALIAIAVVINAFLPKEIKKPRRAVASFNDDTASENTDPSAQSRPGSISEALAALIVPQTLRDPFSLRNISVSPTISSGVAARAPDLVDTLTLSAIWKQGSVHLALINGQVQATGAKIGRLQIDAIEANGIWVTHAKGRDYVIIGTPYTLTTPADLPPTTVATGT